MRKIVVLFLILSLTVACFVACNTDDKPAETTTESNTDTTTAPIENPSFSLRIEGNSTCLFSGIVEFDEGQNLKDALVAFDMISDSVTFTGADNDYITAVNGEVAATFGGWDGWLFQVNAVDAATAMSGVTLSDGDEILLYYGDPYGVGMEYPTYTVSGKTLTFKSGDAPVTNLTVTLTGNTTETLVTDETGSVTVTGSGEYKISIEKFADSGLTLVLRLPEDERITIE